jgi:hypothetical protein
VYERLNRKSLHSVLFMPATGIEMNHGSLDAGAVLSGRGGHRRGESRVGRLGVRVVLWIDNKRTTATHESPDDTVMVEADSQIQRRMVLIIVIVDYGSLVYEQYQNSFMPVFRGVVNRPSSEAIRKVYVNAVAEEHLDDGNAPEPDGVRKRLLQHAGVLRTLRSPFVQQPPDFVHVVAFRSALEQRVQLGEII